MPFCGTGDRAELEIAQLRSAGWIALFCAMMVGGLRLGVALDLMGASMWLLVFLCGAAGIGAALFSGHTIGSIPVRPVRNLLLLLALGLALMAYGYRGERRDLFIDHEAARIQTIATNAPLRAMTILRSKSDDQLAALSGRVPNLVAPEQKRRLALADAREKERLRRAEAWQQSPVGWAIGFGGWILHPSH
jgi:hypothetical protein